MREREDFVSSLSLRFQRIVFLEVEWDVRRSDRVDNPCEIFQRMRDLTREPLGWSSYGNSAFYDSI